MVVASGEEPGYEATTITWETLVASILLKDFLSAVYRSTQGHAN